MLLVAILIVSSMADSAYAFLHNCNPDYCNTNNYESNEGPGSPDCCPKSGAGGYEECFDDNALFKKSTAHAFCIGMPEKEGTDYCEGSYILHEAYINCEFWSCDDIQWKTKDCRDFNWCTDWEYYCTGAEVKKKKVCYEKGCDNGACKTVNSVWQYATVSKKGDDDYCSKRKQYSCTLCNRGDYDCDYGSECSGNLECMGLAGEALDGCCNPGEIWDETNYRCCECSSGPCCDGCYYYSTSKVCDEGYVNEWRCTGNCLDDDVLRKYKKQYCSGSSSSCNGRVEEYGVNVENCNSNQHCDGSTSWGTTKPSCKTAQCTSGVCCDTRCSYYIIKSTQHTCDSYKEHGCPWGSDLGDNVGERDVLQYCSGNSASCNGRKVYGSWSIYGDCTSEQYCEDGECKDIECSSDSDCLPDYWSTEYCKNNDVYGWYVDRSCENPGTKQSACTVQEYENKKEECGTSSYIGNNYCWNYNMKPSVFQDYATRRCADNDCKEEIDNRLIKICQEGCTDGQCNEDIPTNFNIYLNQGWNLISFPLNLTKKLIKDVFENINFKSIFSYGSWDYYFNETNKNFNKINETKGYWINSLGNQVLTIEGTEFDNMAFNLKNGWNLISYPSLNESSINETLRGIDYSVVYGYNGTWSSHIPNRTFNSLKTLKPGLGYWVKLSKV